MKAPVPKSEAAKKAQAERAEAQVKIESLVARAYGKRIADELAQPVPDQQYIAQLATRRGNVLEALNEMAIEKPFVDYLYAQNDEDKKKHYDKILTAIAKKHKITDPADILGEAPKHPKTDEGKAQSIRSFIDEAADAIQDIKNEQELSVAPGAVVAPSLPLAAKAASKRGIA